MISDSAEVAQEVFEDGTGWVLKPEGACRAGLCVPVPAGGSSVRLEDMAERLGMGLVHNDRHGLWALGPSSVTGRALESVEAPDFTLPDLDGRPLRFSSLRGHKVVLVAWASW